MKTFLLLFTLSAGCVTLFVDNGTASVNNNTNVASFEAGDDYFEVEDTTKKKRGALKERMNRVKKQAAAATNVESSTKTDPKTGLTVNEEGVEEEKKKKETEETKK